MSQQDCGTETEPEHPLHALRAEWDATNPSGSYTTWLEWKAVRLREAVDLLREAQRSMVWQESVPVGRRLRWALDVDSFAGPARDRRHKSKGKPNAG